MIDGTAPITLQGAGRDQTWLIEAKANKGLLGVHIDHTVVEDLTLDTQTNSATIYWMNSSEKVVSKTFRSVAGLRAWFSLGPDAAKS